MTEERFDSLEKLDRAPEEERRSDGDRRIHNAPARTGPEHRPGGGRRLKKQVKSAKIVPRKGKGAAALFLSLLIAGFTLYFMPSLIRYPIEEISWINPDPIAANYDVIVVGAEPEGIAAAVAAARNGMKTLLLEGSPVIGGLMTLGQLNFIDMCYGNDGTLLTRGIFEEFYVAMGGSVFDINEAKNYFFDLVTREPLLTLRTGSQLSAPLMNGNSISGVVMLEDGEETVYTAKRVIDATADGDLAALAGAPFTYGGEDIGERGRQMGATLVFELSGVRWYKVFLHLNLQRLKGLVTNKPANVGATDRSAWGYENEGYAYVSHDPLMRLRGFNIGKQRSGAVLINALLIFGVDPLDPYSYLAAMDRAKKELNYLTPYIRLRFAGFEKAELVGTASRLYVRETRHFVGEYTLSIDDVLENRDHWDKIAIGGYPADIQPSAEQPYGTVIGNPDRYAVPFRCLIPLQADNLLLAGRSSSFSSLAASSARVIPLGMSCGQAAGAAAAQSIRRNQDFRHMSRDPGAMEELQQTLRDQGAYLDDFSISDPNMAHWAYHGLASLRRLGLMDGGYQNDYRLEVPIDKWRFQYILNGVIRKAGYSLDDFNVSDPPTCRQIIAAVAYAYQAAEELKQWSGYPGAVTLFAETTPPAGDGTNAPANRAAPAAAAGTPIGDATNAPANRVAPAAAAGTPAGDGSNDPANRAAPAAAAGIGTPPHAAMDKSHDENLDLLADSGLLPSALAPYFADGEAIPQAAEAAMLLANLYERIKL